MNPHRPDNWQKWGQLEFIGIRWKSGPYTWCRALHKELNETLFYCFEKDCAVFSHTYEKYIKDVDINTNFS
jgi:hypothetical protein